VQFEKKGWSPSLQPLVFGLLGQLLDFLCIELVNILGQSNDVRVPGILDRGHDAFLDVRRRFIKDLLGLFEDRGRRV